MHYNNMQGNLTTLTIHRFWGSFFCKPCFVKNITRKEEAIPRTPNQRAYTSQSAIWYFISEVWNCWNVGRYMVLFCIDSSSQWFPFWKRTAALSTTMFLVRRYEYQYKYIANLPIWKSENSESKNISVTGDTLKMSRF